MKTKYYLAFAGFAAPGRYGSSDCDGPFGDLEEFVVVMYVDLVHAHLHVSSIHFNLRPQLFEITCRSSLRYNLHLAD